MTHWRDEGGYIDVETSVQVHEAIEREFGIDIKDRHVLISDVEQAFHIVMQHHDAVWKVDINSKNIFILIFTILFKIYLM